jgi:hypothetical protein
MTPKRLLVLLFGTLLLALLTGFATADNRGPKQIDIFGGSHGKVPFPHAQHQTAIKDCNVCHDVFPQETDAIQKMKAAGTLKAKKVMNLQCIKCHKAEKRAGKPHGPLTCSTCHVK